MVATALGTGFVRRREVVCLPKTRNQDRRTQEVLNDIRLRQELAVLGNADIGRRQKDSRLRLQSRIRRDRGEGREKEDRRDRRSSQPEDEHS